MVASTGVRVSQAAVLAAGSYPSQGVRASQAVVLAAEDSNGGKVRVSQAFVLAAVIGATDDPSLKLWHYSMDSHDIVLIRLGAIGKTLAYDLYSDQWTVFGSGDDELWRAFTGRNWLGGRQHARTYGSNILVGDHGNGALYFLDPTYSFDDDALEGSDNPRQFQRHIVGQITAGGIDYTSCFGVLLRGSIGESEDAALTAVTLETSDNQGHTYDDQGTLTLTNADYDYRAEWWSLGSFSAPGRLFRISDYGALQRIDALEKVEEPEDD